MREHDAWAAGHLLIGVDEAGRGPIAGPVVAAAVVFPPHSAAIPGVRDSKTLSAERRVLLDSDIRAVALAIGIGAASVREVDALNIRRATALAMRRAILRLRTRLPDLSHRILLDGLPMPEVGLPHEALIDGDALCHAIAAAGILAKQVRDRLMTRLHARYPTYAWSGNMGYGTAAHLAALRAHGATPHHRTTFAPVSQLAAVLRAT